MRAEFVSDAEILEKIRHPSDHVGNSNIHTVEGVILLDNNYRWYYGLGAILAPQFLGEIGVRYGYSLYALCEGARSAGVTPCEIWGLDNESYCRDSLAWATKYLRRDFPETAVHLERGNSQQSVNLSHWPRLELFSVDGDHSDAGARHDMELAWGQLRPGGIVLVDDIDYEGQGRDINLRPVVNQFCREHSVDWFHLPTTRGLALIQKPPH